MTTSYTVSNTFNDFASRPSIFKKKVFLATVRARIITIFQPNFPSKTRRLVGPFFATECILFSRFLLVFAIITSEDDTLSNDDRPVSRGYTPLYSVRNFAKIYNFVSV